jgi:iron complex transport system substrate-binding protein
MRFGWLLLAMLSGCTSGPVIEPGGIVSNNPCIDAILAKVAAPEQITAVSAYSHNPNSASAPQSWSRQFPALGTSAEEVIAAKPRLLLTGNIASNGTNAAISRAGIMMEMFGVANSIDDSKKQIATIAAVIGRAKMGAQLNAEIEAAFPTHDKSRAPIPALIWQSDGFVAGEGTLQDDLMRRTGFRNMSRDYGLKNWDYLPLENMLRNPPKVIFMPQSSSGDDGRSVFMRRKILRHWAGTTQIVSFPDQLLYCGGPTIIDAARILNKARMQQEAAL